MKDFKKGFKKAPPNLRRRLVHKVIERLELTSKGLKTYFRVPSVNDKKSSIEFENTNVEPTSFDVKNDLKSTLIRSEDLV